MSVKKFGRFIVYFVFATIYTYSLNYNFKYCHDASDVSSSSAFYKLKYFTTWCFILQTVYFLIGTLNSANKLVSRGDNPTKLDLLMNTLYASLVFPIGSLVVTLFWAVWAIDRELVFPKALDAIFPSWLNHVMHTLPLFSSLIENYFVYHVYSKKFIKSFTPYFIYEISYLGMLFYFGFVNDDWLYPFLRLMGPTNTLAFCLFLLFITTIFFQIGKYFNDTVWKSKLLKIE